MDKTDRLRDYGLAFLLYKQGLSVCGYEPVSYTHLDEEAVRKAIEEDRQSVSKAREAWQNATGKEASDITFKRVTHV